MDGRRPGSSDSPSESADAAWSITSTILSGMLVWGGLGWLVDRWRGTGPVLLPIGVLVGVAAALYLVFVRTQTPPGGGTSDTRSDTGDGDTPQQ